MATPYVVIDLEEVVSTQDEARNRRSTDAPVIVTARTQAAGRGRSGRRWETADVALAVSVAFTCRWEPLALPRLSLVAGLAALDVLGPFGAHLSLKWPNDVMAPEGKVAGILVEASGPDVVVGLGANLWWSEAPIGYATLFQARPPDGTRLELARGFGDALLERAGRSANDWGHDDYLAVCSTVDKAVTWEPDGAGWATGVDQQGRLVVETDEGVVALGAGEIRHVRSVD